MTFAAAPGYTNLPNGVWSPEIFSSQVQLAFRKESVISAITNTDYMGEISQHGDTVRIIKEPNITISDYARGATTNTQDLTDNEFTLVVDKAKYFAFTEDDIEKAQSHINWESLASNKAGHQLQIAMDAEVLEYMQSQVGGTVDGIDYSNHIIGTDADPIEVKTDGTQNNTTSFSALSLLNRYSRILDERNVPQDGRWFVGDPYFFELLGDEDSKFVNADTGEKGAVVSGNVQMKARGFTLYKSNNLASRGTGPSGTGVDNSGTLLAGHMSSTATAETLGKVERLRSTDTFGDIIRGMHVYGRKVLRKESILTSEYHRA